MPHMSAVRSRRGGLVALALLAATAGLVLIAMALFAQESAPQPPRAAGHIDDTVPSPTQARTPGAAADSTSPSGTTQRAPLPASRPVSITIPSIGVRSQIRPIGVAPDGTLAVPQPGPDLDRAAWFKNSPTPGQPGPAIIEGHVDTEQGPSVFFKLGALRPGNTIRVLRQDGTEVVFTVNAVRNYDKTKFPTRVVYGAPDLSKPLLRLITCSNFDAATGHHTGNAVVFAHLTAIHPNLISSTR